ncbi:hypothetical protein JR316_0008644 [Psilocybe cubensis]|uniref:F-box domain-containing protein n=2 Tax=Psilocybe cubensis TaxID=181762 RepID=A0A8H8CIM3_PSICU|nr:hypothetical protein JR316_0008644 [Psilocybe cubensis]KAH9478191.1 hypothetical protein JR316_0008644 [Psilocybe cubensis]
MDTLPTELHAYICQLVCDDDGTTIRTLSSVSKYFNQVTKPYLYRSICATGTSQIMALVERLDSIPSHLRPIERLFLSDTSCKTASPTSLSPPKSLTDRETRYINRLIALSAPTLKTFTFIATSPFSGTSLIARVFRTSFPLLVNLTISGFYPFPSTPGRFPLLNYLHLDGNRNPHGLFQMSSLEDACPSLRSLKVTGLGAAGAFVVELEEALAFGKNLDERSDYMAHSRLPSCLCEITLQAGPELAVSGARDSAATKDQILMKRLQSVKTLSSESLQVSVVERSSRPLTLDDFRLEWIQNW